MLAICNTCELDAPGAILGGIGGAPGCRTLKELYPRVGLGGTRDRDVAVGVVRTVLRARYLRCGWPGGVDGEGALGRTTVGIASQVGSTHQEGVSTVTEPRVCLRRLAAFVRTAIELALEGGVLLRRGEVKLHRGAADRVLRTRCYVRIGRAGVDLEGDGVGCSRDVANLVGGLRGDGVGTLREGLCVRNGEGVGSRPVGLGGTGKDAAVGEGDLNGRTSLGGAGEGWRRVVGDAVGVGGTAVAGGIELEGRLVWWCGVG